jgi:transcriptional repressor NrdR
VLKSGGRREPLDRDKLSRSMSIALRKRTVEPERVERAITGIIRRIESSGQTEVTSDQVGELVMDALSQLDQVAYIRYASVYRNFREAQDFENFVGTMNVDDEDEVE